MNYVTPLPHITPQDKSHYFYIAKTVLGAGTSVLEPIILNKTLKREKSVSSEERRIIVFQDALRQGISFAISTLTFVGGGILTRTLLKHHKDRGVIGLISGMVMEKFVGKLFLKPILTTKLTAWWHARYPDTALKMPPSMPASTQAFYAPALLAPSQTFQHVPVTQAQFVVGGLQPRVM